METLSMGQICCSQPICIPQAAHWVKNKQKKISRVWNDLILCYTNVNYAFKFQRLSLLFYKLVLGKAQKHIYFFYTLQQEIVMFWNFFSYR